MLHRARNTVMWVGKAAVFLIGLAVIAVTVLGVASTAFAGNGDPLKLGQKNTATKLTTLIGNVVSGAALSVRNSGVGPALDLRVEPGQPPMVVSTNTLVANLNADTVDGKSASSFVANSFYTNQSPVGAGSSLGDGTFAAFVSCNSGDRVVSGGPANVDPQSTMVESFPDGSSGAQWKARINKNGQGDDWNVVALCANQ